MNSKHKKWDPFVIPPGESPSEVFQGFTADDELFLCREIQRATDGIWGHTLIAFRFSTGGCYFEALLGDGVTGPWPIERLFDWESESNKHRLCLVLLASTPAAREVALCRAMCARGRQSYSAPQLLAMGLSERYGLPVWRSERKTVCSEYAAYVLEGIVDLRDRRRRIVDQVNPNSAWRRVMEEKAGFGTHTRLADKAPERPQDGLKNREALTPDRTALTRMQRVSGGMQRGCEAAEEKTR